MVAGAMRVGVGVALALACVACGTTSSAERSAAARRERVCAVQDPEATTLPIYATGCVAFVDGVPVPPREVNLRGRMLHLAITRSHDPARAYDDYDLPTLREEMLVELVEGAVLTRELDRQGFTIDDETYAEILEEWSFDAHTYELMMSESVGPGVTAEDADAMMRGWGRARAYACSVHDCEATRQDMLAVYEEKRAEAEEAGEVFESFEDQEFAMRLIARDRKWMEAYRAVVKPLVEGATIERLPQNVVVNDAYLAGER